MSDLIPYSQMPGFIPAHPAGTLPTFEQACAVWADGEIDAVLRETIQRTIAHLAATHAPAANHTQHHAMDTAGVLEGTAHGR